MFGALEHCCPLASKIAKQTHGGFSGSSFSSSKFISGMLKTNFNTNEVRGWVAKMDNIDMYATSAVRAQAFMCWWIWWAFNETHHCSAPCEIHIDETFAFIPLNTESMRGAFYPRVPFICILFLPSWKIDTYCKSFICFRMNQWNYLYYITQTDDFTTSILSTLMWWIVLISAAAAELIDDGNVLSLFRHAQGIRCKTRTLV